MLAETARYMEKLGLVTTDDPKDADAYLELSLKEVTDPLVPPESNRVLLQGTCRMLTHTPPETELILQSRVTSDKDLLEAQRDVLWQLSCGVWMQSGLPPEDGAEPIDSAPPPHQH